MGAGTAVADRRYNDGFRRPPLPPTSPLRCSSPCPRPPARFRGSAPAATRLALWFAALAYPRREPWVHNLCTHLLRGTPAVVALLGDNPFPGRPPRLVRAVLYEYRFTTPAEKAHTGHWWRRAPVDYYFPAMSHGR